jgi:uncharacterized membrane protein YeaQ/YmgE (transglycosylase-associated protein family)
VASVRAMRHAWRERGEMSRRLLWKCGKKGREAQASERSSSGAQRASYERDFTYSEATMHLILFLIFGLIVGALARLIVPGRERGGWLVSMLIGVVGSFVGGLIGRGLGLYRQGESAGFLMSLLGAVLLVAGYHAMTRRRSRI